MTVSLVVNNPTQTISLDMVQEQPTQSVSLVMAGAMSISLAISDGSISISSTLGLGSVTIARQPVSVVEMPLFGESGLNMDFLIDEYAWKA